MNEEKLRKGYNGYRLTERGRSHLLAHITPVHPDVLAHHVTHDFGIYESLPPDADHARVIAVAENHLVQAALVQINGQINRGDASVYHITISVDRAAGGKPVDSNGLLADDSNWQPIDPFNVDVEPAFFPFGS